MFPKKNKKIKEKVKKLKNKKNKIEELKNENKNLKTRIEELENENLKTHAEFQNIKKRIENEKLQAINFSNEKIIKDMIPVLDSFDSALKYKNNNIETLSKEELIELNKNLIEGITLTQKLLINSLNKHGLEVVNENIKFDPNIHNAIQTIDNTGKEKNEIIETYQKGYIYKGRNIREAMVSVSSGN